MTTLSENLVLQKTKLDSLSAVKNLSLWGSDLTDVSLIRRMPQVEVLSLSVNRITSLQYFSECKSLKELYLRKNEVSDLAQVRYLGALPLKILWLCDNPCAAHPLYRLFTIRCCAKLEKLDNVDIAPQERVQAERLTSKDIQDVITGSNDAELPRLAAPAAAAAAAPTTAARRNPPPSPPLPLPPAMPQPGASGVRSNDSSQRAMVAAILTLVAELTPDNQLSVYNEIGARLKK